MRRINIVGMRGSEIAAELVQCVVTDESAGRHVQRTVFGVKFPNGGLSASRITFVGRDETVPLTIKFPKIPCRSPLRLAYPSLPTMMWSCTAMPSGRATATIAWVISMSAREGVGSPLGWLCARIIVLFCFGTNSPL